MVAVGPREHPEAFLGLIDAGGGGLALLDTNNVEATVVELDPQEFRFASKGMAAGPAFLVAQRPDVASGESVVAMIANKLTRRCPVERQVDLGEVRLDRRHREVNNTVNDARIPRVVSLGVRHGKDESPVSHGRLGDPTGRQLARVAKSTTLGGGLRDGVSKFVPATSFVGKNMMPGERPADFVEPDEAPDNPQGTWRRVPVGASGCSVADDSEF